MAGNNDPGKHHLRLGESRIRLHTTAWNAVLAMAARAIYAVTPPSPPPTGTQAAARAPGQASPAPGTIPLTAPEPARPPAAIQLRALAGLTVPPLVPLSPVQPAHQLAPEAENALVRQRMAAAVLGMVDHQIHNSMSCARCAEFHIRCSASLLVSAMGATARSAPVNL